ncbi:MAG: GAF domain-containing protein [Anaerolineae bacterium]|nr:GAF domain-containing protein [Anaerolineae bacterium]
MMDWIRQNFASPVFTGDEHKTRVVALLNTILLVTLLMTIVSTLGLLIVGSDSWVFDILLAIVLCGGFLFLRNLLRHGHVQVVSWIFSVLLWIVITVLVFTSGGIRSTSITGYFLVVVVVSFILGVYQAVIFGVLSALSLGVLVFAEITGRVISVSVPVGWDDWLTLSFTLGLTTLLASLSAHSISRALVQAQTNEMILIENNRDLHQERVKLEARTHNIERRTQLLQTTVQVGRMIVEVEDLTGLLPRIVVLISEHFGFYHTAVFMLDESGQWAVLRAASSELGAQMLARAYRLRVGQTGRVGDVIHRGVARIESNLESTSALADSPDLPETRSAMTLPLRVHGRIVGALDVQSKVPEAYGDEEVAVLQMLADQVAIAIHNAQLLGDLQTHLDLERRVYGASGREPWGSISSESRDILHTQLGLGYVSDVTGVRTVTHPWGTEMVKAYQTGQTLISAPDYGATIAIPIIGREGPLGVFRLSKPEGARAWTDEEIELMEVLTQQMSVALESARLYRESQRLVTEERLVGDVTARIRESLEVDDVLRVAVTELRGALQLAEVEVRMGDVSLT